MLGIDDAALALVLGGLISTAGSLYINKKNLDANDTANQVNWDIARQNNATQIEMANTAHQREVRDLRAAGLNPILSAGGSGASSPMLQGANLQPFRSDNLFEGLANSAKGLTRYFGETYKAQLLQNQATALDNESVSIENDIQKNERALADIQYKADHDNAQADSLLATTRLQAAEELLGKFYSIGKDGKVQENWSGPAWQNVVNLQKEGIEAELKNRSNVNWRGNLGAFMNGVGPVVNSARSLMSRRVPVMRRR